MDANACKEKAKRYAKDVAQATAKYERLKDMDLFVLDNSIRESTVGQLRGHTLKDKWAIYEEARKCGFGNYVVASFNHMTRVDDVFIEQLIQNGADPATLWAFSEITDGKFIDVQQRFVEFLNNKVKSYKNEISRVYVLLYLSLL